MKALLSHAPGGPETLTVDEIADPVAGPGRGQAQREEPMGDGSAERRRSGGFGIDMDELVILGAIGEGVDPGLSDIEPFRHPDLLADQCL